MTLQPESVGQAKELKHVTFVHACRQFFGIKLGQPLADFAREVRDLTEKDKKDLIEMFATVGYDATKVA